jgi:hypothetical protein
VATIIDELIVKLGLDASQFQKGQQQAQQSLTQFQAQTTHTSQNVFTRLGHALGRVFGHTQAPIKQSQTALQNLGQQARQTGNLVSKSGQTGAVGLAALTSAGLGAFAVLKGIREIVEKITSTMQSTAGFGRIAQWAGFKPDWLSQFATAAHIATNAPQEATVSSLYGIQQDIEQLAMGRGGLTDKLQMLQRLGIDVMTGTPQERMQRIIEELPKALERLTLPQAQAQLAGVLPPEVIQFLKMGPGQVQRYMAEAAPISITKEQTETMMRLQQAFNRAKDSWDALVRAFENAMGPVMIPLLESFAKWEASLAKDPEALRLLTEAAREFGGAIQQIVEGFKQLFEFLNKIDKPFMDLLKAMGVGGIFGMGHPLPEEEQRPGAAKRGWNWLKNKMGMETDPALLGIPSVADPRTAAAAKLVAANESAGGTDAGWNYLHSTNPNYYTASGIYQQTRSNWMKYRSSGANQYPNAMDAPPIEQYKAFSAQFNAEGLGPWSKSSGGSLTPDTISKFNQSNQISSGMGMLRDNQAGSSSSTSTTNNNTNSVGDVNVNVQTGANPYMIGDAVKRSLSTNQANVGLE